MFGLIYILKIGILAGVIMGMVSMILNMAKFTNLDLTTYVGCLITKKTNGLITFFAGFFAHLIMSVFFALFYAFLLTSLHIPLTIMSGIIIGCVHTFVSGLMMPMLDMINPCVKSGALHAMGFATSNLGIHAVMAYTLIHIVYAVIFIQMFAHA